MKKGNIIFLGVVLVLIVGAIIFSIFLGDKNDKGNAADPNYGGNKEVMNLVSGKHYALISVKGYGKIKLELDADIAPITVTNFLDLINEKFYDGLTFHRIMDGFMIQGGGYDENGDRKLARSIEGEFAENGKVNTISHKRGVISMARAKGSNTASSEFFITQADSLHLDGKYAAFGYVIEGMDVVDKIAKKAKPTDDNGSIELKDRPVIEYIKVVEK